jgi:Zn-finger protein
MNNFKRGDQILYIPDYANENRNHPDVEAGFVTSTKIVSDGSTTVFCRFWRNRNCETLRTKSNSEGCDERNLIHYISVNQQTINHLLNSIEGETKCKSIS